MRITYEEAKDYSKTAPWWYGLSHEEFMSGDRFCYPIPFNWVVRIARVSWKFIRGQTRFMLNDEFWKYRRGYIDGYHRQVLGKEPKFICRCLKCTEHRKGIL